MPWNKCRVLLQKSQSAQMGVNGGGTMGGGIALVLLQAGFKETLCSLYATYGVTEA